MTTFIRNNSNPILCPDLKHPWEKEAAFNGSVVKVQSVYHLLYRAISSDQIVHGKQLKMSTIGHAISTDGKKFVDREQFITPSYPWDQFGCEDPRITYIDGTYYIFYTAISTYPPNPSGIKVGLAITKDFKKIENKHLITPFNAKAMMLFPEKINGKFYAVLTVDTDIPPAKICIVSFEKVQDMWDMDFWTNWYQHVGDATIPIQRSFGDQVEVGVIVKTDSGWLLFFSYITNYRTDHKIFSVEALLLDNENPLTLIKRTASSLLDPQTYYETYGNIPNIVFPSGALLENETVSLYYGATDTTCCLATAKLTDITNALTQTPQTMLAEETEKLRLVPFEGDPILSPIQTHSWEESAVFNTAALRIGDTTHLIYRAIGESNISVLGYATTKDGLHITERLMQPIYIPRESFEKKGCEDPRLIHIGDRIYMCYTAYDGITPRVALTSIAETDFLSLRWNWDKPVIISPLEDADKDASLFPEKINDTYIILHRLGNDIWITQLPSLTFTNDLKIRGEMLMSPRKNMWDNEKIGLGAPPVKTDLGWLLLYHGVNKNDQRYRLGLALLDKQNPSSVLLRLTDPILEPIMPHTNQGSRPGTVFSCGLTIADDTLFVYLGAGDSVTDVARMHMPTLLTKLQDELHKIRKT